jgi:hypothetical protein
VGSFDGNRVGSFDGNTLGVLVVGILESGELEGRLVGSETMDDEDSPNAFIGLLVGT